MWRCEVLLITYFISAFSPALQLKQDDACTTPNNETGLCIPLNSCEPIREAVAFFDSEALTFARKSQCGYDIVPLVCCGTVANLQTTAAAPAYSTPAPSIKEVAEGDPVAPLHETHLPDSTSCGLHLKQNRISGGSITELSEFPWMVALKYTTEDGTPAGVRCGGTLINHRYILTAAQCLAVPGYNLTEVRLGEWRLATKIDCVDDTEDSSFCADPPLDLAIVEKIPHAYYSKRSGNNDIALLRVAEKVNYTEFVRPICLPPSEHPAPKPGTKMHISGWGLTENGTQSDYKRKVVIPMVSNAVCAKAFPNYSRINPNQACAGGQSGKDACNGDSGGPLMRTYGRQKNEDEQWYQEGIIYRGLGCGQEDIPGLYTRVSRYTHWILNNLKYS